MASCAISTTLLQQFQQVLLVDDTAADADQHPTQLGRCQLTGFGGSHDQVGHQFGGIVRRVGEDRILDA